MAAHTETGAVLPREGDAIRILLVDDQPANLVALSAALDIDGAEVVVAQSGIEALKALLQQDFAVIVMDVQMPTLDGFATASIIKGRERCAHVPIIFVTAEGDDGHRTQSFEVGAVDYLTKPIDMRVFRAKVGAFVDLQRSANVLKDESASLVRDETELVRLEAERRYRDLAESMPQIVWIADGEGRISQCNEHWFVTAADGSTRKDGCAWEKILHPEDLPAFLVDWERGVREGVDWSADHRFGSSVKGTFRWHMVRVVAIRDEAGKPTAFIGTSTDIDDRRQAEDGLRLLVQASTAFAERDIDDALATVADLVVPSLADACVVDVLGDDGVWRRIATTHVDPTRAEGARAHLPFLVPKGTPGSSSARTEIVDAAGGEGEPDATGAQLVAQGLATAAIAPCSARGELLATMTLLARPGRRIAEREVALLEDVARRAATALDSARSYRAIALERTKLIEANRAKDDFLAVLSHELRTPLNSVLGWTKLLRAGGLTAEAAERALETIERGARSQVQLVADLVDVSRIVSGKLQLAHERVDLAELVRCAVETFRPAAAQARLALEARVEPSAVHVRGDRARLEQILMNLLSNAIKFTREGSVLVTLERVGPRIELVVSDTGQGIPPEFLPHIFDRFQQADSTSTRQHGGLGLGLAIVRHLVELHRGSVVVESAGPGRGTRFIVDLPLLEATSTPPRPAFDSSAIREHASDRRRLKGLRVLIVDDDPDGRDLICAMLENMGVRVRAVGSARDALAALAGERPDILVSDIGLPGQDGYSLVRELRSREGPERTPAVALTAYVSTDDAARALAAGFDAHLAKPIEEVHLVRALAALAPEAS